MLARAGVALVVVAVVLVVGVAVVNVVHVVSVDDGEVPAVGAVGVLVGLSGRLPPRPDSTRRALRRTRRWCEPRGWETPRNVTSSVTSAGELMRR